MTIQAGQTSHYLTDYYPQWVGADKVETDDARLVLTAEQDDWSMFTIATEAEALVSTVDVWHGDSKLSIVVLGGIRTARMAESLRWKVI
jgi:hypothetical protein